MRADACVVGTGAGGAPVAHVLARAGMRVAVLEEGEHHDRAALNARPRDMTTLLYRDAGQTLTIGSPPIMLPLGSGIGGTTLVNSGTCFRVPDRVMERWSSHLGLAPLGPGALDVHYAHVEQEIGVGRVTEDIAGNNALIARRGAERLGWSGRFIDRNARGCRGSGVCAFGCPTGAKQHAGETYMRWAHANGATTYTGARARRVTIRAGRARGVEATTRGGGRLTVLADRVIVAAGALHTPGLLAASGIRSPALGRHLSVHPCTAAWALMDEIVDLAHGVPQSYCVDEFADDGMMLEGIAGPPDYLAMAVPYVGDRHREVMLRYRSIAQFGLMIEDTSRGRVVLNRVTRRARRPVVRYDVNARDRATIGRGISRLVQLLEAAGARRVVAPRPNKLMAFHPLGTARAAARPADGVVDADGQVHGIRNLYVSDGSAVPTALGVNPQLTIMALARRLACNLIE